MKLEKIISLANKKTELLFLAMVRSLRQTGCNLPVWVIPFNDERFDLPDNCIWWEIDEVISFLDNQRAHKTKRKYQCLLTANYQFVDADIIFLKSPETELAALSGFITSCCHWNNPDYTFSQDSVKAFKKKSTTWQKSVFNSGQFACDTVLYDFDTLKEILENNLYAEILTAFNYHEQLAFNFLVFLSGVAVTNITLPPYNVESTWAGDYLDSDYERYWTDERTKPYLIHWAGCKDTGIPIDQLFINYLTPAEKQEWENKLTASRNVPQRSNLHRILSRLKRILKTN